MKSALVKTGFIALTDSKYLTYGDYLLPGEILLNESNHTATNVTEFKFYVDPEIKKLYLSAILDLYDRRIVA